MLVWIQICHQMSFGTKLAKKKKRKIHFLISEIWEFGTADKRLQNGISVLVVPKEMSVS